MAEEGAGKSAEKIRGAGTSAGEGAAPYSFSRKPPPRSTLASTPSSTSNFLSTLPSFWVSQFPYSSKRKISPKRKFLDGHPADIRGSIARISFSQRQSITQKGVHAHSLTAREREHWFLQHLSRFLAANFGRQ